MESHPRTGRTVQLTKRGGDLTKKGKVIHTCLRLDTAHRVSGWTEDEVLRVAEETWGEDLQYDLRLVWRHYTMKSTEDFIIQEGMTLADKWEILSWFPETYRDWFRFSEDHIQGWWDIDPDTDQGQVLSHLIENDIDLWGTHPHDWPTRSEIATTVGVNSGRVTELINPNDNRGREYNQHGGVLEIDGGVGLGLPENYRTGQDSFGEFE